MILCFILNARIYLKCCENFGKFDGMFFFFFPFGCLGVLKARDRSRTGSVKIYQATGEVVYDGFTLVHSFPHKTS